MYTVATSSNIWRLVHLFYELDTLQCHAVPNRLLPRKAHIGRFLKQSFVNTTVFTSNLEQDNTIQCIWNQLNVNMMTLINL